MTLKTDYKCAIAVSIILNMQVKRDYRSVVVGGGSRSWLWKRVGISCLLKGGRPTETRPLRLHYYYKSCTYTYDILYYYVI